MFLNVTVALACAAFVCAAAHIFVLVFFRADNLCVTAWFCTVDVAFAWFAVEVIFSDYYVFNLVYGYGNTFVKYVHLTVP